ncbi:Uncharacterized protein dnm_004230 [Desulfonema magnum]|uniref:Uncharacterized protein n=1 Tax=Desulfonema magnum TaxID=45655 RepID=A0A975BFA2_9BACT|nr:Uncharacterized protein dnm_004230 [Desulfonema magnum]
MEFQQIENSSEIHPHTRSGLANPVDFREICQSFGSFSRIFSIRFMRGFGPVAKAYHDDVVPAGNGAGHVPIRLVIRQRIRPMRGFGPVVARSRYDYVAPAGNAADHVPVRLVIPQRIRPMRGFGHVARIRADVVPDGNGAGHVPIRLQRLRNLPEEFQESEQNIFSFYCLLFK